MDQAKKIVLGILAHVDSGKTTLAEGMLYACGVIRSLGRVDHQNAFLDNFSIERERGITVFSKQAELCWRDMDVTLLDTPGHVDFSAEMERTLQVLDYAVLVINGADGVQGHTRTLWRLLERYEIPTFLFVNKMDQDGTDEERLFAELRGKLHENCVKFAGYHPSEDDARKQVGECREDAARAWSGANRETAPQTGAAPNTAPLSETEQLHLWEEIATCDEDLMESFLADNHLEDEEIAEAVAERKIFPCYFGSALRTEGVWELLEGLRNYTLAPEYPEQFGARVYKISRDGSGTRLTHLKVTGGTLRVKQFLDNENTVKNGEEPWQEKADQLRIYNGARYELADEVAAGEICAVTGLTQTFTGQGLGCEVENELPVLEPVLTYRLRLPEGTDAVVALGQLRRLEEEEPLLHILWKEESREIHVQVMGEVQTEVLKKLIEERYGMEVGFDEGSIVYKETIAAPVVGIGHFEPLRHYAEVHLLMEPGEAGSGLQFASLCSEDELDRNWQRLILTHLEEKAHVGVLTGAQITDMRIVLVAGRAHLKHTEGGDFRQAVYRAVRQGLRKAESVLLEPVFAFTLEVPTENLGRAMSDIQRMSGSFEPPLTDGETSIISGKAPVSAMGAYQREVNAYTHGLGRLSCVLAGYEPCHNAQEVIAEKAYDPEADLENPTGSVFCAHGAGFVVNWDEVDRYAHLESQSILVVKNALTEGSAGYAGVRLHAQGNDGSGVRLPAQGNDGSGVRLPAGEDGSGQNDGKAGGKERYITQEEIDAIFRQTYGKKETDARRRRRYHVSRRENYESGRKAARTHAEDAGRVTSSAARPKGNESAEKYLLVDGYNIIFAWEELRELAEVSIDGARDRLIEILSNYHGTQEGTLILVYDAYKVKGNLGSVQKHHNIYVVYTKEAETADQYIEKTVHEIGRKHHVTVATSDALEQMIIWGDGAVRMSARGLKEAVDAAAQNLREDYTGRSTRLGNRPFEGKV